MIALVALVLLLAQVAAPPPAPLTQNQAPVPRQPAPFAIPPVPGVDRVFAVAAIQGNNAEIDMAQMALKRASSPEVKNYAQKMMSEHMGLADDVTPVFMRLLARPPGERVTPPDALAITHLATIPDVDFDQVYALQQVGDHLATLTAFRTEADNGTDPQLKALARKWLPTIQAHLELAVSLTRHIGGASPLRSQ